MVTASPKQVEALRQIIIRSALWGWDMGRRGASEEMTERLAAEVDLSVIEPSADIDFARHCA